MENLLTLGSFESYGFDLVYNSELGRFFAHRVLGIIIDFEFVNLGKSNCIMVASLAGEEEEYFLNDADLDHFMMEQHINYENQKKG